jgi:hypothetical protein
VRREDGSIDEDSDGSGSSDSGEEPITLASAAFTPEPGRLRHLR